MSGASRAPHHHLSVTSSVRISLKTAQTWIGLAQPRVWGCAWLCLMPCSCRVMLSRYNAPFTGTKPHCCLCFPSSKGGTTGLIPYRNNSTISSRSYNQLPYFSFLNMPRPLTASHGPTRWPWACPQDLPPPPRPCSRMGGSMRGVAAWDGGSGSWRLRRDGDTLLPKDHARRDSN